MIKAERIKRLKDEKKEVFLHLKTKSLMRGKIVSFDENDGEIELVFAEGDPDMESKSYVQIEEVEYIEEYAG